MIKKRSYCLLFNKNSLILKSTNSSSNKAITSREKNTMLLNRQTLLIIISLILFAPFAMQAQETKKVKATYTYYAQGDMSINEAKEIALDRAKIEAIANEFGTLVHSSNATLMEESQRKSSVDFTSVSGSDVKGEWIKTTDGPFYDISFTDGDLIVTCTVSGVIREIESSKVLFDAKILRNGKEARYESDDFKDGDDIYLMFKTPVSGYLAVFMLDAEQNVNRLLPYRNMSGESYAVKKNKEYIFFSTETCDKEEKAFTDEYCIETDNDREANRIYVIFSRNKFVTAYNEETSDGGIPVAEFKKYHQWLSKARMHDNDMQVMEKVIFIRKQ